MKNPGRHFGQPPENPNAHDHLAHLHRMGFNTITSHEYGLLVKAGVEPSVLRTLPPSCAVPDFLFAQELL